MNRAEAMEQLGADLGVGPIPTSITGIVAALGGTRAAAGLMPATINARTGKEVTLASKQRTLQRYMNAEKGTGKQARGTSAAAHSKLTGELRAGMAEKEKKAAQAKHPHGFHAKVKGNFFLSYSQRGRAVKPVWIDPAGMEAIIDEIQAGDYNGAADAFDDTYGISYDVTGMSWGEDTQDSDAFDSLTID